jgi:hypothetical protein
VDDAVRAIVEDEGEGERYKEEEKKKRGERCIK